MMEIWKKAIYPRENGELIDFSNNYEVSNLANIRSIERIEEGHYLCSGGEYVRKSKLLKQKIKKNNRLQVTLYMNGNHYFCLVHRLVAFAFPEICGEYFKGAVVDHIDTNPLNCLPENLKWCSQQENCTNPITLVKKKETVHKKTVSCYNDKHRLFFHSITEAKEYFNMKSETSIINCLNGRSKTAYGYKWKYV